MLRFLFVFSATTFSSFVQARFEPSAAMVPPPGSFASPENCSTGGNAVRRARSAAIFMCREVRSAWLPTTSRARPWVQQRTRGLPRGATSQVRSSATGRTYLMRPRPGRGSWTTDRGRQHRSVSRVLPLMPPRAPSRARWRSCRNRRWSSLKISTLGRPTIAALRSRTSH